MTYSISISGYAQTTGCSTPREELALSEVRAVVERLRALGHQLTCSYTGPVTKDGNVEHVSLQL